MVKIDPQQELFTYLKLNIAAKGYDVYDGFLPPKNTPYPFVYLGKFSQSDSESKTELYGTVYATIHVWSNTPENRGTVSKMLSDIKAICRSIGQTKNFSWFVFSMNQDILSDSTTNSPLLHGFLEVGFKFS